MTFIAEWGDRSQLATIVLAGINNVYGVIVGQQEERVSQSVNFRHCRRLSGPHGVHRGRGAGRDDRGQVHLCAVPDTHR